MRYEQRLHIVRSLENLIYQLIAISFLLSPSFLPFACRVVFQFQFSRPRELDPRRSLRFWYILNLCFNASSVWGHAAQGVEQGRSIVIDFIGQATKPSKIHLLLLDFAIIFLNMVLISIAYESTLHAEMPTDTPDPLLPIPLSPSSTTVFPSSTDYSSKDSPLALDLRFNQIVERLRNPPPPPPPLPDIDISSLPLPGTSPWRIPATSTFSLLMGGRLRASTRARARARANTDVAGNDAQTARPTERRTIPGGLDSADVA